MVHPDTPVRSHMDDPKIKWRTVKPNYSVVNEMYLKERTRFHPVDSLEKLVENLVKTWEMESTHKIDAQVSHWLVGSQFLAHSVKLESENNLLGFLA